MFVRERLWLWVGGAALGLVLGWAADEFDVPVTHGRPTPVGAGFVLLVILAIVGLGSVVAVRRHDRTPDER